MKKLTYWLYIGSCCLTAVRMPHNASKEDIIAHAIASHQSFPIQPSPYAPIEWQGRLRATDTIKVFPNENPDFSLTSIHPSVTVVKT